MMKNTHEIPVKALADNFDLHPEETGIIYIKNSASKNKSEIFFYDFSTKKSKVVLTETSKTLKPPMLHSVHYLPSGKAILFRKNEETFKYDIETKELQLMGEYKEDSSIFNAHVIRNKMNKDRSRYLYFTLTEIKVIKTDDFSVIFSIKVEEDISYRQIELSASGKKLAIYVRNQETKEQTMHIWNVDSGKLENSWSFTSPERIAKEVQRMIFSPDDAQILVAGGYAEGPVVFETKTGKQLHIFNNPGRADRLLDCFSMAFSFDGKILAVGSYLSQIYLFDANTFEGKEKLRNMNMRTYGLKFTPDSKRLISGGDDGKIFVTEL